MNYFDNRPQLFRILFGILAAVLLAFASIDIYMFGKSPTDENIFQDPPSNVYYTRAKQAERLDKDTKMWVPDSLRFGDMPTEVNGKSFPSLQKAQEYIRSLSDTSLVTISVLRPEENRTYLYRLRKSVMSSEDVRTQQPTAWVTNVTDGGASDRAGMKVGDLITRINGQTFSNVAQADSILRSGQIGKTIDYDILRSGQALTLHVTLASFGIQFAFLMFIIAGLCYIGVGTFLAESRPEFAGARLAGLFLLALGYFMVIAIVNRGLDSQLFTTIRNVSLPLSLYVAFPLFLHATHYFPKERPDLLQRRWIRIGGYALALTGFIGSRFLPGWGPAALLIGNGAYAFLVPVFFRKGCPPDYKTMNRLIKWSGLGIGAASLAFGLLVPRLGGVEVFKWLTIYSLVLLILPISYLITVGRYRLFNLTLRIRRTVQYSMVSVLWTVVSIIAFMGLISWLVQVKLDLPYIRFTGQSIELVDTPTSDREQSIIEKGFLAAIVLGSFLTLARVYRAGDRLIARKFYRARYDYRRASSELADVMSTTLNMNGLAREIVEKLASLMQLKKAGVLFFRDQSACCCHEAHGFDGNTWMEFCVTIDDALVDGLKQFTREVGVDYLPASLKERFRQQEFHFVIPIRSKEKLVGALLIGEKKSEALFQNEDLEFLGSVAKQASVAIENAFLYEELAEQERMKHELAIARKIQLESLPQSTPEIHGLDIAGISIPALEVGGDYFDYLNGDPAKLTVIVGDVSGKGTSAALYMSKVQGILRSLHGFGLLPRELFIRANHLLCKDLEKRSFVTAMGAAFDMDRKQLILARAGHLPLFHFNAATKCAVKITPKGLGLGLSPEELFAKELEEREISFGSGDIFVFVTDGITEGQQLSGDEFGEERVLEILEGNSTQSALSIRDKVIMEVKSFAGEAHQHDDQTVVVVKSVQ